MAICFIDKQYISPDIVLFIVLFAGYLVKLTFTVKDHRLIKFAVIVGTKNLLRGN